MKLKSATRPSAILAALLCFAAASAEPARAQQPVQEPTATEAQDALRAAEKLLDPGRVARRTASRRAPVEATLAMNRLAAAAPALSGADRRDAEALLARPTDSNDRYNDDYPDAAPVAVAESAHFCVFWVSDPGYPDAPDPTDANGIADGDAIPDYVEAVLEIAEYSYSVEVAPGPLGWVAPKRDREGCGADPGARTDVYLKQLGNKGLFGYESPDPGQQGRSQSSYLVIDDDYAAAEYGQFADPLAAAKVTFAHEFNHALQQTYDSYQDLWMFESTATWSEDRVYPEINDYVNYVRAFANNPGKPLTDANAGGGLKIYGSAVWNHWLDVGGGGLGGDVVRRAWEVSDLANPADLATASYDRAIGELGGRGFSREFVRFAAATAEWRSGFGGFPDGADYQDMRRQGSLEPGDRRSFRLDHTGYRLLDVEAPSGEVKLSVRAEQGVRSGLALVGRGPGGAVTIASRYLDRGGVRSVSLERAESFERITAVIANADVRVKGFSGGDWVYARDDRAFSAKLSR